MKEEGTLFLSGILWEKISLLFGCIICFPGYSVVEGIFFISNSNQDPEAKSTQSQSEEKELLLISVSPAGLTGIKQTEYETDLGARLRHHGLRKETRGTISEKGTSQPLES